MHLLFFEYFKVQIALKTDAKHRDLLTFRQINAEKILIL